MKSILKNSRLSKERGAALLLAMMCAIIMVVLGGSFALLVQNEIKSVGRGTAYEQALYVAESGVEDILYQRSKNQSDNCAPYDDDGSLSGAAGQINGPAATCDTDNNTDADISDADKDYLPCWSYNDKLYANKYAFGPNFYCHDGSDSGQAGCGSYNPLAIWPAGAAGGIGWKDMDPTKATPLPNAAASSGQRYTTGFFTQCNDDFAGDDTSVEPAKSKKGCLSPPCNRAVMFLSIVSVGEVETRPGDTVRRAVKVDILPLGLFSGVIDQFVDMTGMIQTDINGPIHINGWWNSKTGQSTAFLLFSSASIAPLLAIFDPPELVSVSYPEDPASPDWQPPLGLSTITYVHLPMRLDIPQPQWAQFEDRMKKLYADALGMYGANQVHKVKRGDYDPGNMYNPNGDGSTDFGYYMGGLPVSFCDAGKSDASIILGDGGFSGCRDAEQMMTMRCPGPWADPQCCTPNGLVTGRIHNCNRNTPTVWSDVAIDLYDFNTGSHVSGTEMSSLGGGAGPRDKSLRYVPTLIYDLHLSGGGCGFSNLGACLSRTVNKPEFKFMGKHEYQGKVFIDGTMGIGTRTPFHTCGEGDGTLTFYCIIIHIPLGALGDIDFHFGVPHWHFGNAKIKGELLVNGKLFMADYVQIDGGAVYADDHVIKDETSALDIMLNVSKLLKSIIKLLFPALGVFPVSLLFDLVWAAIDLVFQVLFPWWPTIDLTNNGLIDFEVYLDINGWNTANVVNSGTIYTRGDFRYENPDPDLGMSILNLLLSLFTSIADFGIEFVPAVDPIRIWNYGAIIAGGKEITGAPGMYQDGNIYLAYNRRLDVLVGDPSNNDNTIPENTAYMFARNSLQISSDLITHYSGAGLFDNCNAWLGVDADCAAQGIFYSGGVTADANPNHQLSMFTTRGGGTAYEDIGGGIAEKKYHPSCIPFDDPDFFGDALDNISCWASNFPILCGITGFILGGTCDPSEIDIKGFIFAAKVGGMPNGYFRLDQNADPLMKAVERRYYGNLTATPLDWMEIQPPTNLGKLN